MKKLSLLLLLSLFLGCNTNQEKEPKNSIVKFWSIQELQFNAEEITLDDCTKQDYLDVRDDGIALSFHCEYQEKDSIPFYHTHKLNWERKTDSTFSIYSDDRVTDGELVLNKLGKLEMTLHKSDNRIMTAVFQ